MQIDMQRGVGVYSHTCEPAGVQKIAVGMFAVERGAPKEHRNRIVVTDRL